MLKIHFLAAVVSLAAQSATVGIKRVEFGQGQNRLAIEILNDKIVHFEITTTGVLSTPIYLTPQVDSQNFSANYSGPIEFRQTGNTLETRALKLDVDPATLCVSAFDKVKARQLTKICPYRLNEPWKGLSIAKGDMTDVFGLGQQFLPERIGNANGNWINEIRSAGEINGNGMPAFNGGGTGNTQFPVMYALGPNRHNYALFLDQVYKQTWDFRGDPWKVDMWGDQIRGFLIAGDDLPELRTSFMTLVGRPLVPPKKSFGLWVSEYGFESWDEIRAKLRTLRANKFPVDGFMLDLQWFGGVDGTELSPMGTLAFDEQHFPNPEATIRDFREQLGVDLITIEESYVSKGLPEHKKLEDHGYLARQAMNSNTAFYIDGNPWWGLGGMIDWTNPGAGKFWHDWKRQPLVDMGIIGHWTDLGEPEMYTNKANPLAVPFYYGFPELGKFRQADIHNVYSLLWHKSIFDGYQRHNVHQRLWVLSRSGGPGMQRYGAGMWSGDIGSNFGSLAAHLNVQMHMSMSGLDYFGCDIGGFHRGAMSLEPGTTLNELYTQWFANGTAFDFPVRPHTENLSNAKQTAPDRVGDKASNLANIRLRYELSPYYYSLAHRAYLFGEPMVPPLVYYYQDAPSDRADFSVRTMGHEKMIGRDLLFAAVAGAGQRDRDIYLPPGEWIDYRNNKRYASTGQAISNYPEYANGLFRLPLFVRAGAIVPKMFVDDKTLNIEGMRSDGSVRNEMIARVYSGRDGERYEFTAFEDDGRTTEYQSGKVATTVIEQTLSGRSTQVRIGATTGTYNGAPQSRNFVVELVLPPQLNSTNMGVNVNGNSLPKMASRQDFDNAQVGWFAESNGIIMAKSGTLPVNRVKNFTFSLL